MDRRRHKKTFVLESLEGKLLLAASPMQALPRVVPLLATDMGSDGSTTTDDDVIMTTGTGIGTGTDTGTGFATTERESFSERGNRTRYDATTKAGGFRFRQSFSLDISRDRRNRQNDGNVVTATQAIDQFYNDLQDRRDQVRGGQLFNGGFANNGNGNGTGTGTGNSTAIVERSSFRERGNNLNFSATLSSGGFRFRLNYSLDLSRTRDRDNDGNVVTSTQAIDQFFNDLFSNRDRVRGGALSGGTGGSGTGTGTTA